MRTENLKAAIEYSNKFPHKSLPFYAPFWAQGQKQLEQVDGKQPGDPAKAATVIVDVVAGTGVAEERPWPSLLALGTDAREGIKKKCQAVTKTLDDWADVSVIEF